MVQHWHTLLRPGLQAREIELHEAYAKLTAGAMERGKMRTQLINTEVRRNSLECDF